MASVPPEHWDENKQELATLVLVLGLELSLTA
jgi:hypothetical protein